MQPARFRQDDILLVEINNAKSTSPAVSSGEERGLLYWTAAGNRAYTVDSMEWLNMFNKLMSVFHTSVLLLIMNFIIFVKEAGDPQDDSWVDRSADQFVFGSAVNLFFYEKKNSNCLLSFADASHKI